MKSKAWYICMCSMLFVFPAALCAAPQWGGFQNDSWNTGTNSMYLGPFNPELEWFVALDPIIYASPAVAEDGSIYMGAMDGILRAYDVDGTLLWTYGTKGHIDTTPALDEDGSLYFGATDGYIYALESDGALRWSYKTYTSFRGSSVALGSEGNVYIGGLDANLYALNSDGSFAWLYSSRDSIWGTPAVYEVASGDTVYFGSNDNKAYRVDHTGSLMWSFATGDDIMSAPTLDTDGTCYIGSKDTFLYAINSDGTQKWRFSVGVPINHSSGALVGIGDIVIGTDNSIVAVRTVDGSQDWVRATGSAVESSAAVDSGNTIYIGTNNSELLALNPSDGSIFWSYTLGSHVASSPAIVDGSRIVVGCFDQNLYVIGQQPPTNTPTISPTPTDSPIPTETYTPAPPTDTPIPTDTPTITPTPTVTPTWTPVNLGPQVFTGGYMTTKISSSQGGTFQMLCYVQDLEYDDISEVALYYDGRPTGVTMTELQPNVYVLPEANIPAGVPNEELLLEVIAKDSLGNEGPVWPYMTIHPGSLFPAPAPSKKDVVRWEQLYRTVIDRALLRQGSPYQIPWVLAAGYWDTRIDEDTGGDLTIRAFTQHPEPNVAISNVEIYYNNIPSGALLLPDPMGPGVFSLTVHMNARDVTGLAGQYLLELVARDERGSTSVTWPYLTIE